MKRRKFVSQFTKLSLLTTAAGITVSAAENLYSKADETSQDLGLQVSNLKKKINAMESNQKNLVKALCVITAYSTGIDLTMII